MSARQVETARWQSRLEGNQGMPMQYTNKIGRQPEQGQMINRVSECFKFGLPHTNPFSALCMSSSWCGRSAVHGGEPRDARISGLFVNFNSRSTNLAIGAAV